MGVKSKGRWRPFQARPIKSLFNVDYILAAGDASQGFNSSTTSFAS
jgi:hypothetical protein